MKTRLLQKFYPLATSMFGVGLGVVLAAVGVGLVGPFVAQALTTEPVITNVTAVPSVTDSTQATVNWTTDQTGTSEIMYGTTTAYSLQSTFDTNPVTSHSQVLTGLTPGALYHYQVLSQSGTSSNASPDETFTAAASSTATSTASTTEPVISAITATPTDTTAAIAWTTDQAANSQIMYGTTTSYGTTSSLDSNQVMSHSQTLTGLTPSTTYHFQVMSTNATGTAMSLDETFTTNISGNGTTTATSTASTTAPVISAITGTPTDTTATIAWTTDQGATSQVTYGTTTAYGATTTLDTNDVTNHSVVITGLSPSTMYHYQVWSQNPSNMLSTSTDQTLMTNATSSGTGTTTASTTAPLISGISVTPANTSALITWTTDTNASSQVAYGTSASYGSLSSLDSNQVMSHSQTLSGLTPGTTYHYQIMSDNTAGNATSSDLMFMTSASSTTGTGTTTPDLSTLQGEIITLQNMVTTLQQEVLMLVGQIGQGGGGTGTGTTTSPVVYNGPAAVDQNGQTVARGGTIDFGGHNFGHEDQVTVSLNGNTVTSAHADGGGNFSTGSLTAPATPGTYTYHFAGQPTGRSADATVTVT